MAFAQNPPGYFEVLASDLCAEIYPVPNKFDFGTARDWLGLGPEFILDQRCYEVRSVANGILVVPTQADEILRLPLCGVDAIAPRR